MASIVSGIIENINISGTSHAIASTAYGICDTAAITPIKNVEMTGFKLDTGVTIHVKFSNANSADSPKLKFNGEADTNAKPIVQYGTTAAGKTSETNGWYAGAVLTLTYDGTSWVRDQGFNTNSTYSYMRPYGSTASDTAAKTGTAGWKFQLTAGKYFMFTQYYDNTAKSALTLNIGSTGAKPIYINGQPSSSTNYTLPGGQYLVYYDGTNYHFRTDDKIPGNIAGNAATVSSIALSSVTGADDLKAIEALSGTSGLLKKTAANTWALDSSSYATSGHNHDDKYIKIDGTSDIGIVFGDNDKFLHFKYNTSSLINNSWRLGVLGSGSGDANYFVIQSGGVNNSSNGTWNNAIRIGQSTYNVYIGSSTASSSTTTGALTVEGGVGVKGSLYADKLYGAVWNDYAEYRQSTIPTPGACVVETDNGILMVADERLIPGACIISDTFGYAQGKTSKANTPIAVAGRVLAYPASPREWYHAGQAVCSAPGGYVDIMTREEIQKYPDAIVGIVSEIPDYEYWGPNNIEINGRIWIKVR